MRWGLTFTTIGAFVLLWYFFAFSPVRIKISSLKNKLISAQQIQQESTEKELGQQAHDTALHRRFWHIKGYNNFLKDLLEAGFITKNITIETSEKIGNYTATSFKISIEGAFDKFYEFLKSHQAQYLCLWNNCVCTLNSAGKLAVEADITLYSK